MWSPSGDPAFRGVDTRQRPLTREPDCTVETAPITIPSAATLLSGVFRGEHKNRQGGPRGLQHGNAIHRDRGEGSVGSEGLAGCGVGDRFDALRKDHPPGRRLRQGNNFLRGLVSRICLAEIDIASGACLFVDQSCVRARDWGATGGPFSLRALLEAGYFEEASVCEARESRSLYRRNPERWLVPWYWVLPFRGHPAGIVEQY